MSCAIFICALQKKIRWVNMQPLQYEHCKDCIQLQNSWSVQVLDDKCTAVSNRSIVTLALGDLHGLQPYAHLTWAA